MHELDADEFARFLRGELDVVLDDIESGPYSLEEWWDIVRNLLDDRIIDRADSFEESDIEA